MLHVAEHKSKSYGPRTYQNGAEGDVTVAFAVDFTTAGEKLTKKAAGDRYVGIPMETDPIEAARILYKKLRAAHGRTLNVAGNGIHTLGKHGWSQEKANAYVYGVLAKVHEHLPLDRVISGGQTGVDLAGGVAGVALGVETVLTLPKGLIQRHEDGVDREHTEADIIAQIESFVAQLNHSPTTSPVQSAIK